MKKLLLIFVAMVCMTMLSCGNKTAAVSENLDSDTVVIDSLDTTVVDTVAFDSVCMD